ncbi:hypothetical protein Tco_0739695 [Tanacetum coccineum]
MAPKRATRLTPAATAATTSVTNAQLQAMIDQGVTAALAARDAIRSMNGEDNHVSGTSVRRMERVARESRMGKCTDEEIDIQEWKQNTVSWQRIQKSLTYRINSTDTPLEQIPYDTSDPANRFCPNGEEIVTLEKESRSKLDKDKEIARLLAIPSPPPSPLSPLSSPLPQIPSPPLPVSSPVHVSPLPLPTSPTYPLGYRVAMIWLRAETPSTSIEYTTIRDTTTPTYTITYSITTFAFTSTSRRADVPEVTLPPRKRADYGFVATLDDEIRRGLERDVGYGIIDTWNEMLVGMPGAPVTDDTELGRRMIDFVTTVRQDMDEIYRRLGDAQDDRLLMSGRLNTLYRDRRAHARTALLMEREARLSREAWGRSMTASDTARSEVMALRT